MNPLRVSTLSEKHLLLFDGDCGICTWCGDWAKAHDHAGRFEVKPYYEVEEAALEPYGLDWEACTHAVQLITKEGKVRSGAFAVNAFLWRVSGWRWLVVLLHVLFPLLVIEMAVYFVVARNRHRVSAILGMNACRVRFDDEPGAEANSQVSAES